MLSATCYTLLQYAEVKADYDSADKRRIDACRKASPDLLALVTKNDFALIGGDA